MRGKRVLVVGAGASGLMAASRAAEMGADVVALEKMGRPAGKIHITGNGRCNVATGHELEKVVRAFGPNGRFLYSAFSKFYTGDLVKMMKGLGVPLKLEPGKRYFPQSDRAADVAFALVGQAEAMGARILAGCSAVRIEAEEGRTTGAIVTGPAAHAAAKEMGWQEVGVRPEGGEPQFRCPADAVILATGGMSYPATGSSGDGYRLAAELGHTILPPRAALIPIVLGGKLHKALAPLPFKDVEASLKADGKTVCEGRADMMFTPFGATGPAILNLGKTAAEMAKNNRLTLSINFFPGQKAEQMDAILSRRIGAAGKKALKTVLEDLMPKRAVPVLLNLAGAPPDQKACETPKIARRKIAELLTDLTFPVAGVRPIEEAIVTAGGVSLKEVHPATLESKLVKGLHFSGEMLDLDGPSGGYNLLCAFSTGRLAGESAAKA